MWLELEGKIFHENSYIKSRDHEFCRFPEFQVLKHRDLITWETWMIAALKHMISSLSVDSEEYTYLCATPISKREEDGNDGYDKFRL